MIADVRKLSNGAGLARPVYQHGHFCVRSFHRFLSYPGYSLFIFLLIYLVFMDIKLYHRIRSRDVFSSSQINQTDHSVHIFDPLPIKKIMIEPMTQYVRSPIAEHIETTLHFTYYFPFISANMISYFHCLLSLISIKFLSHENLFRRQIGVIIFQIRIFFDSFDGVIFRAHSQNKHYKSYYGDNGYFVDVFSDILGGICLLLSCLFYFSKQRSIRMLCLRSNENLTDKTVKDEQILLSTMNINNDSLETKENIFLTLFSLTLRYSFAALFWDRNVHAYEDLLDSKTGKQQQKILQLSILHSPLTILIFYFWRYLCGLSIQDYILVSIFIDRTWEFLEKTSRISWCILLLTIFLTELHINQIRSLFHALENS